MTSPDRASPSPLAALARANPRLDRLLQPLPEPIRAALGRTASERSFRRGEVIVTAGEAGGEIGFVLDGALGVMQTLAGGRAHVLGILAPPDLYGLPFDRAPRHRVEALSDGLRLAFDRAGLEQILDREPALERMFLTAALEDLQAVREWLLLLNGGQATQRVAAFLVILTRRRRTLDARRKEGPVKVRLPAPRVDIARHLGMRPETFSRAIHKLADDGLVRIINPETFEIREPAALVEASGADLTLDGPGP
ncbi:Crp/Fnr family transcriptional regulator [Albimonas pacifica]|uniref:CRP/FNR family transcriptional regulator, anaerobic regulatory protein n=1 Tax=Albimonas pacifica TaxID=1114924 RepID=A0A1I3IXJ4_9RHOB|nr:Crp/Fnr family transcriptional regulator [Albimonas pacifica]SFI52721.1 CRP/FNR family transcriptional regulator, anaerobic regulatory protein [Albimonas pacifica]